MGGGVDRLDELVDFRRHDKDVSGGSGAGIPVGVRCSAGNDGRRAGVELDLFVIALNAKNAFHYVPSFVIVVVQVPGSDIARRSRRRAGVSPFGDDKGTGCNRLVREWRGDGRSVHSWRG